jgi:uncharacterized protein (DUF934 family)
MKTYTLFWLDGKKELIRGDSITEAYNAEYNPDAIIALDFWTEGESDDYRYDTMELRWKLKPDAKINAITAIPISES